MLNFDTIDDAILKLMLLSDSDLNYNYLMLLPSSLNQISRISHFNTCG